MKRPQKRSQPRRFAVHSSERHAVAVEAARLLYHREFKEYYQAKREAARRHSCHVLPTNSEIHRQLLLIADFTEGSDRTTKLSQMRRAALRVMDLLQEFKPRLIGSVWTGHIRAGSDIDIHLYASELEQVERTLQKTGLVYEVERVNSRRDGVRTEFIHIHLIDPLGFEVEMTVYPPQEYFEHPTCSITGGPMARASLAQLRRLLQNEPAPPQSTTGSPQLEELRALLFPELKLSQLLELFPELAACSGVMQNHYHHLDVLEHSLAVVSELTFFHQSNYEILADFADPVKSHLQAPFLEGWSRYELLILGGLFHDLGKPSTASLHRSGRIRFLGHERVGAGLVRQIARRLDLPKAFAQRLESLVALHMEAVLLPKGSAPTSALYDFFQSGGDSACELLLLSLADLRSAQGPAQPIYRAQEQLAFVLEMLDEFFNHGFLRFPNLPVSSVDLETEFGLQDPKLIARLLERLTRDYIDCYFQGREDGLCVASELLERPAELW